MSRQKESNICFSWHKQLTLFKSDETRTIRTRSLRKDQDLRVDNATVSPWSEFKSFLLCCVALPDLGPAASRLGSVVDLLNGVFPGVWVLPQHQHWLKTAHKSCRNKTAPKWRDKTWSESDKHWDLLGPRHPIICLRSPATAKIHS